MAAWEKRASSLLDLEGGVLAKAHPQAQAADPSRELTGGAAGPAGNAAGTGAAASDPRHLASSQQRGGAPERPSAWHAAGEGRPDLRTGAAEADAGIASQAAAMYTPPPISLGPAAGGAGREAESPLKSYSAAQQAAQASPAPSPMGPPGIPRVPRSPSYQPMYGSGRSYNIRIGDEQQVLAKFTPRSAQQVYHPGDTVSGVLTFPSPSHSKKPLKRHWRCLEVCVQLETHESSHPERYPGRAEAPGGTGGAGSGTPTGPGGAGSAEASKPQQQVVMLHPTSSVAVAVRTEYHECVLDLASTHFLFTIPMDAPAAFTSPTKSMQWVLHFEFVAFALPSKERRQETPTEDSEQLLAEAEDEDDEEEDVLRLLVAYQQQQQQLSGLGGGSGSDIVMEKAEWSMPITVQGVPASHAKRRSAATRAALGVPRQAA